MLREELIPTAIIEDCFPARNFLGLFGLKELRKTFNNLSRLQTLGLYLPPLQNLWSTPWVLFLFFTKAKSLEHFFPPMTRFSLYFSLTTQSIMGVFFSNGGESHTIIGWHFIYLIFQYDMNQNKFFIVIKAFLCTLLFSTVISLAPRTSSVT